MFYVLYELSAVKYLLEKISFCRRLKDDDDDVDDDDDECFVKKSRT